MNDAINSLSELPSTQKLRNIARAIALLDAVLMPEWEYRYFSFDSKWADGIMLASARSGEDSGYFIEFHAEIVIGKVYSTNSGVDIRLPTELPSSVERFLAEPAFQNKSDIYYFWGTGENNWTAKPARDSYCWLKFFAGGADFYHAWAERYYERAIDIEIVREVFSSLAIGAAQLHHLNPDLDLSDIAADINQIIGEA